MPKDLERDLGLYATITISIGAMVGSGIFVLPGLATKIAGPAVVLAYLLAGVIVLPAALSKAEMATAMPQAGGTYLYIDRAMGPLPGTVAGVGAWFSLVFKSAFALVGLGSYLVLFAPVPTSLVVFVALGLAILLLVVNVVGVKQTGTLQAVIVSVVLLSLVGFVADGMTYVQRPNFHPFFAYGGEGLLAATGFVFVSYAGVTKIASVAEEVEDPSRNIPMGILFSIGAMMLVYTLVVFVVVGVTPPDQLTETLTPMAAAADNFAGDWLRVSIAVVAVLALTSMANAGVLSSARFPFAMSRDDLAPDSLGVVHERFKTPIYAIGLTGGVLLVLIALVPVVELAKLASAFQILVFCFVNAALVAFRESNLESYDPEFVAPGYPWVQLFGIVAGLSLIPLMGLLPIGGALGIVVLGVVWYQVYGRERTDREGAALNALRRTTSDYSIDATEAMLATGGGGGMLVAVGPDTAVDSESTLLRVADAVGTRRGGRINATRFSEVPDQTPLAGASDVKTAEEREFEATTERITEGFRSPVETEEVVTHDLRDAVANYARRNDVNLVIGEWEPERFGGELLGADTDWYMRNVPVDFVFVQDRGIEDLSEIVVVADRGPYDPLEILVADALASVSGATIRFVYALPEGASDEQVTAVEHYHERLGELCSVRTGESILETDDRETDLLDAVRGADLVVASTSAHHLVYDVVLGSVPDTIAREHEGTVLLVHSHEPRRHTFLRYLLDRFLF